MTACTVTGGSGVCCGQVCQVGGNCCVDTDCIAAGVTCAPPLGNYPNRYAQCDLTTHICTRCDPCQSGSHCKDKYCCDFEIGGSGQCVGQGIYSSNSKYLCDPPNGFKLSETESLVKQENLFSKIFRFFGVILFVQNLR
jgi:hypothetical protein